MKRCQRQLGLLERWYAASSAHGCMKNVAITLHLTCPCAELPGRSELLNAVLRLIAEYPLLALSIDFTEPPTWKRENLETILRAVESSIQLVPRQDRATYVEYLERGHNVNINSADGSTKSEDAVLWDVVAIMPVLNRSQSSMELCDFEILFFFHHALLDGKYLHAGCF